MNSRFCVHEDVKMASNLIKITFLFVVSQGMQLSQANPSNLPPPSPSTSETPYLTPTDPLELNKIAFHSLVTLYDKVGPLIYTLLTEKNALGDQMGVVSKIIVDRIGVENYSQDMELIFSNLLDAEVEQKLLDVYDKIRDIGVQNDTNRSLEVAVEIIKNILQDEEAVAKINDILKTGSI